MRLLGCTRVSTAGQDAQLQLDALVGAGVQKRGVFSDVTSGSRTAIERPGMKRLLDYAQDGDTVVFWRIDRLGCCTGTTRPGRIEVHLTNPVLVL